MEITLHTKIYRDPDLVTSKIDDEIVMMSIEKGEYYGLDEIGTRIWDLIEKPYVVDDLIKLLMEEFEVDLEECQSDTLSFLNDLYEKGLLKISTGD